GWAGVYGVAAAVNTLPKREMFAGLPVDGGTTAIAFGALAVIAVASALWPAWRAARLTPVEALSYERGGEWDRPPGLSKWSRNNQFHRQYAPARGRWQAKACPTFARKRLSVGGAGTRACRVETRLDNSLRRGRQASA